MENNELTKEQIEILTGTLLGDSSLQFMSKKAKTPIYTCTHGKEQKDYAELKAQKLGASITERNRFDKRTEKIYESYYVWSKTNPYFLKIYDKLYKNKKKVITNEFLENFTDVSLAYLYMDDGYTSQKTAFICTDAFDDDSIFVLIKFLEKKYSITFRKVRGNRIRLAFRDRIRFCNLIEKHMMDNLKYKLPPKEEPLSTIDNYKKDTKQIITELQELYGTRFDYSLVEYINISTPICLIENGEKIWRKPSNLLKPKYKRKK